MRLAIAARPVTVNCVMREKGNAPVTSLADRLLAKYRRILRARYRLGTRIEKTAIQSGGRLAEENVTAALSRRSCKPLH